MAPSPRGEQTTEHGALWTTSGENTEGEVRRTCSKALALPLSFCGQRSGENSPTTHSCFRLVTSEASGLVMSQALGELAECRSACTEGAHTLPRQQPWARA